MVLLAELPVVRRSADGARVHEGGQLVDEPSYGKELGNCAMPVENTGLAWHSYFAGSTDVKAVPTIEEQDALTVPANPDVGAAENEVVVCAERLPLGSAVPSE